ncbi:MAG: mechanosensitive ion channel family protein [Cyclobacteriaceae bacterium]|nr:mechanosensitive ion channel family protein [Cyclobacteriaceae bacterium]
MKPFYTINFKTAFLTVGLLLIATVYTNAFQNEFATPRSSVAHLEKYTSSENADLSKASLLISSKSILLGKKRKQYIQEVREILDAIGYQWELDSIPDSINYVNHSGVALFVIAPDIALENQGGKWLISKRTIDNIPALLANLGLKKVKISTIKPKEKIAENEKPKETQTNAKNKDTLPKIRLDLSSPRSLILGLSKYMSEEYWRPDVAQQVIYYKHKTHRQERIDLILKLKRFSEGKGILIDAGEIPDDPDYIDTLHLDAHEYVITPRFAELYLEKIGDRWYLSKETVEKIPELFEKAYPFGSDRLLIYLPSDQTKYMGLMAWQYIAILLLVIISFVFNKGLFWVAHYIITRILFRFGRKDLATTYIRPVVRPLSLMVAFAIVIMFLPILQLPVKVSHYLSLAFSGLIPLFGTMAAYKITDIFALYFEKLAHKTDSSLDDQLVPLFRKIAKTFVIIIGGVYVLANLNVQLVPLLATLSIGGIAFALAAQDTIKNFFGSLMIFIDKPFQVGQWITAAGIDGTVEEVGIRSTRIRTFSNSLIYVPNGKLADAVIDNHGLRSYRRFTTQLAVTYDTPPELLEIFIDGLRKIVLEHPKTWKDNFHIYMNEMNSHSLDVKFYIFFAVPTWAEELNCRHEVILSILKLAHKLGVQFAFPTQTLHMQDFPGQPSLSPKYSTTDKANKEMEDFFKKDKP